MNEKLYVFYCVAGILLLIGCIGMTVGFAIAGHYLMLIPSVSGLLYGILFLYRAGKMEEEHWAKV